MERPRQSDMAEHMVNHANQREIELYEVHDVESLSTDKTPPKGYWRTSYRSGSDVPAQPL